MEEGIGLLSPQIAKKLFSDEKEKEQKVVDHGKRTKYARTDP